VATVPLPLSRERGGRAQLKFRFWLPSLALAFHYLPNFRWKCSLANGPIEEESSELASASEPRGEEGKGKTEATLSRPLFHNPQSTWTRRGQREWKTIVSVAAFSSRRGLFLGARAEKIHTTRRAKQRLRRRPRLLRRWLERIAWLAHIRHILSRRNCYAFSRRTQRDGGRAKNHKILSSKHPPPSVVAPLLLLRRRRRRRPESQRE